MTQLNGRPAAVRDCPECRRSESMKLQNSGIFTAYYVCEHCHASMTVPPPPLVIPPKHFENR